VMADHDFAPGWRISLRGDVLHQRHTVRAVDSAAERIRCPVEVNRLIAIVDCEAADQLFGIVDAIVIGIKIGGLPGSERRVVMLTPPAAVATRAITAAAAIITRVMMPSHLRVDFLTRSMMRSPCVVACVPMSVLQYYSGGFRRMSSRGRGGKRVVRSPAAGTAVPAGPGGRGINH
jgi:hypothetical protein